MIEKLLSIGSQYARSDRQRRKLRVTVGIIFGVMPGTSNALLLLLWQRLWVPALVVILFLSMYFVALLFVSQGRHLLGRNLLAYNFTLGVWIFSLFLGKHSGFHYILLYGSLFPFALFEISERRYAYTFSAVSLALFAMVIALPQGVLLFVSLPDWLVNVFSYGIIGLSHFVVFVVLYASFASAERYEDAVAAENAAKLEAQRLAVQKDWDLTATVQRLFLPKQRHFQVDFGSGLEGISSYRPAQLCGGDWWWWERGNSPRGETLDLLIGDVTGHGPASAMITAAMSSSYRMLQSQRHADPLEVCGSLNQALWELCRGDFLFALSWVRLFLEEKRGVAFVAGTPPPLIAGGDQMDRIRILEKTSAPLGNPGFEPRINEFPFEPGDRAIFLTDGVTELTSPSGGELGLRRALKMVQDMGVRFPSAEGFAQGFDQALDRFQGSLEARDDRTWMSVHWKPSH